MNGTRKRGIRLAVSGIAIMVVTAGPGGAQEGGGTPVGDVGGISEATVTLVAGSALFEPYAEVTPEEFVQPPVTSPYAFRNFPDRVFFGDMHMHSNLSPDAGLLGTSLTAADVFRAARGETVMSNTGQPFRLVRPLDFLVLTDHAEAMGLAPMLREGAHSARRERRSLAPWHGR